LITTEDRPLVTFPVFAFNQEEYVREAVRGAFSQTYSPLEIILSDDCSSDSTFHIMKEMAAEYRGPHRLKVRRNESNLGLARHVNRVMEVANGELIVGAAGDDISEAERASWAVETWRAAGGRAMSITSDVSVLLEMPDASFSKPPFRQQTLEEVISVKGPSIMGCAHAWHRRVFDVFGPLPSTVVAEDRAIAFRSMLLGVIAHDPRKVVRYRVHGQSMSFASAAQLTARQARRESWLRFLRYRAAGLSSYEADLRRAASCELLDSVRLESLLVLLRRERERIANELSLYSPSLPTRVRGCRALWKGNVKSDFNFKGRAFTTLRSVVPLESMVTVLDSVQAWNRRRCRASCTHG